MHTLHSNLVTGRRRSLCYRHGGNWRSCAPRTRWQLVGSYTVSAVVSVATTGVQRHGTGLGPTWQQVHTDSTRTTDQPTTFHKCHRPSPPNRSRWPFQTALQKEIRVPGRLSHHAVPPQGPQSRSLTRPISRARTSSQPSYVAFAHQPFPPPTVFSRQ